jgi:hypothetical protein
LIIGETLEVRLCWLEFLTQEFTSSTFKDREKNFSSEDKKSSSLEKKD